MKEQCQHIADCEDILKCGCVTVNEVWKDIPEYEGLYQVSNLGGVKRLKFDKERVLKPWLNKGGYYYLGLCKGGTSKKIFVHRLVMLAFVGESDLQVNHVNGDKTDNRLENLEYCTGSENLQHAYDTGLRFGAKGEKNGNSKLTRACVERIKYGHQKMKLKDIAKIYGINLSHVSYIRSGKSWSEV